MSLQVDIVTPTRRVSAGEYDFVVATALDGEVGILPGHHPMMVALGIGPVRLRKGDDEERLAVENGFLEVAEDRVIVLAESAERPSEIDVSRARAAEKRALDRLAHPAGVDVERARRALERAHLRIRLGLTGGR